MEPSRYRKNSARIWPASNRSGRPPDAQGCSKNLGGKAMAAIASVEAKLHRTELPVPLADSMHGTITHFELVLVRLRDRDGTAGTGYTYTVGAGGIAVEALIQRDLQPLLLGADAELIEAQWQRMWWGLHYGGRGGPTSLAISAVDIALW